jgi:mannose-6-phosphate isomerase-like protein (cupin superfamily)
MKTTSVKAKHTTLTEILNGIVMQRLAITEPIRNFRRVLHRHLKRDDYIYLLSGEAILKVYDGKDYARIPMRQRGDVILVKKGIWHSYETGDVRAVILEASSEPFDRNDAEEFQGAEPPIVEL